MHNKRRVPTTIIVFAAAAPLVLGLFGAAAEAAPKSGKGKADRAAPQITIVTPTSGASLSGDVTVSGSSGDNVGVQSVSVSVDGGAWQPATGTGSWSWRWASGGSSDGSHTIAARAVDTSGNVASASVAVTVANATSEPTAPEDTSPPSVAISAPASGATVSKTVSVNGSASDGSGVSKVEVRVDGGAWQPASGSGSWGWSWDTSALSDGGHTLTARATDHAGNTSTTSRTVTVANTTDSAGDSSGGSTGVWTSPEGVKIDIQTTTGGWTHDRVYAMLTANARDLAKIGPTLKVVVQDAWPSYSSISASSANGRYSSVAATIQLDARSGSTFANRPDDILSHEYGHVWFNYYAYLKWQGSWDAYLSERWTMADGSKTLATDSRTDSSYIWTPDEIAADDYRLLFGSDRAIAQRNASLNQQIPDPRSLAGLKEWLLTTWAG